MGLFVINSFKAFGKQSINDDEYLTVVGAVSSVFNGIRFFWSYLVDRFSFKFSYMLVLCVNIIFGSTIVLVRSSQILYLIWVCMLIWALGAHYSLVPTICAKLFGVHASIIFGFAYSFCAPPLIVSSIFVRLYLKTIGYEAFYYAACGLSGISLVLLLFIFEEKKLC